MSFDSFIGSTQLIVLSGAHVQLMTNDDDDDDDDDDDGGGYSFDENERKRVRFISGS